MSNVMTLLRREFNAYFVSVLGYVIMMLFLGAMGLAFTLTLIQVYVYQYRELTVMQVFFQWFWLPSLVVVPVLTMRLLAEEKRAGTIEVLMTAPVTDWDVVFAKWLGAVFLYGTMWSITLLYVPLLQWFARDVAGLNIGTVGGSYVGVLLIGQFLISIGILASSLTKNQIIAALISFSVILMFVLASIVLSVLKMMLSNSALGSISEYLSLFEHMSDFSRGIMDLRPVVFYLSGTVLMLFITVRVVESRRWR